MKLPVAGHEDLTQLLLRRRCAATIHGLDGGIGRSIRIESAARTDDRPFNTLA
jgi:hypothetical protein